MKVLDMMAVMLFGWVAVAMAITYPYGRLSPQNPLEGDAVNLTWVLEAAPGCERVYQTKVLDRSRAEDGATIIAVDYEDISDRIRYIRAPFCTDSAQEYSATFHLGALDAGRYRVMHHDTLMVEFAVEKNPISSRVVITPSFPLAGDTVDVHYIIDTATSACVPSFRTTVERKGTLDTFPALTWYEVSYQQEAVPAYEDVMCAAVMTPYGPHFSIPTREPGTHELRLTSGEVIARFTVGESSKPALYPLTRFSVDNAQVGKTVSIQRVLGKMSSGCAPRYVPGIDSTAQVAPGVFVFYLSAGLAAQPSPRDCASYSEVEFGPGWSLTPQAAGTYLFMLHGEPIGKLQVAPVTQYSFDKVTISGTVYVYPPVWLGTDEEVPQFHLTPVAGCTLSVALPPWAALVDVLPTTRLTAISDEQGRFTLTDVPVKMLLDGGSVVYAFKDTYGSRKYLGERLLQQEMDITLYLAPLDIYPVPVLEADSLLKARLDAVSAAQPAATPLARSSATLEIQNGMLMFTNPASQRVTIGLYNLNGRLVQQLRAGGVLGAGAHRIELPRSAAGMLLVRVHGENYELRQLVAKP